MLRYEKNPFERVFLLSQREKTVQKTGDVRILTVFAMFFSIGGRILSQCFDKSALRRHDKILGIYCGLARPACANARMHCPVVNGFSSVTYARKPDRTASYFSTIIKTPSAPTRL